MQGAAASWCAALALDVLQSFGEKTTKHVPTNPVRWQYVWEDAFIKLLDELCAHPDSTIRLAALQVVTRGMSPPSP